MIWELGGELGKIWELGKILQKEKMCLRGFGNWRGFYKGKTEALGRIWELVRILQRKNEEG
eukprot:8890297-Pyramimonas_sp.AAC.1